MNIRFVKQEVIPLGPCPSDEAGMLKRIELAGRAAYKSEDKITEDSALGFAQRMKQSGHLSVLEHSNITFRYPLLQCDEELYSVLRGRSAFHTIQCNEEGADWRPNTYISGNVRAWIETLKFLYKVDFSDRVMDVLPDFEFRLSTMFSGLFGLEEPYEEGCLFGETSVVPEDDQRRLLLIGGRTPGTSCSDGLDEIMDLPVFTFKIICDRGISHELVRHRVLSFTQESTRYVNYAGKGMTFIEPEEYHEADSEGLYDESARVYENMITSGLKPQIARDVLPNLLKTELYISGRWSGWKHFIELRDSPAAHPRIQRIAVDVRKYFEGIGLTV